MGLAEVKDLINVYIFIIVFLLFRIRNMYFLIHAVYTYIRKNYDRENLDLDILPDLHVLKPHE
jgi:hypothetical protein